MPESFKMLLLQLSCAVVGIVNGVFIGFISSEDKAFNGIVIGVISFLIVCILVNLGARPMFSGYARSLHSLDTTGNTIYRNFMVRGTQEEGNEKLLSLAEANFGEQPRLYLVNAQAIRDGVNTFPKDDTPFKLIKGSGDDDIVVILVPEKEKAAPATAQSEIT